MADFQQNFLASLGAGYNFGQQIKQQQDTSKLNQLASQAYGAAPEQRDSILSQTAAVDAGAAGQLERQMGYSDERRNASMMNMARLLTGAPEQARPGLYRSMVPTLAKFGMSELPQEYNAQTAPIIDKAAQSIMSALNGGKANNPYDGLPADIQSLRLLKDNPELAKMDIERRQAGGMVPKLVQTAQGYGWGAPGGAIDLAPVGGVAGQGAPAPQRQDMEADIALANEMIAANIPEAQVEAFLRQRGQRAQAPGAVPPAAGGGIAQPYRAPATAPSGYRAAADGGLEVIPGGPAQIAIDARKDAADAKKAAQEAAAGQKQIAANARQAEAAAASSQLVSAIDTLTSSAGFGGLGTAWGDVQLKTPLIRSDVKDAQAQLKNIAGQVALTTMAKLKALSSQGATGFGALSAPELKLLENSIATLQSEDISNTQLVASLKTIRDSMTKINDWQAQPQAAGAQPGNAAPSQAASDFSNLWN